MNTKNILTHSCRAIIFQHCIYISAEVFQKLIEIPVKYKYSRNASKQFIGSSYSRQKPHRKTYMPFKIMLCP